MSYLNEKNQILAGIERDLIEPYLFARGYFTEIDILPGYVNPLGLEDVRLGSINWDRNNIPRTSSIDILIEKPDKGLRRFSLIHPYIYIHLVHELLGNLELIKSRLLRETGVEVYSIPTLVGHEDISVAWKHFSRIDPAQYFLSHGIIVSADIYNFYGSVYTHSVSWAIHGRDEAKNRSRDFSLVGNRFDKLLQNAHDGQTNGIPVGNVVSDVMAELVLKDIDELITPLLRELDIKAFRYKDDYRFVCKSKKDARAIIDQLALSLNTNYGLALNQSKTRIENTDEYMSSILDSGSRNLIIPQSLSRSRTLSGVELYDYIRLAKVTAATSGKSYFDGQLKQLIDFLRDDSGDPLIIRSDFEEWAHLTCVSLIDAVDMGLSTAGYTYLLIDLLIDNTEDADVRDRLITSLTEHTINGPNVARQLWTYAVLLNHDRFKARRYARAQGSALFRIAASPTIQQITVFNSRDPLTARDITSLEDFILINFELFGRINGRDSIFTILEDDFYNAMTHTHYDD